MANIFDVITGLIGVILSMVVYTYRSDKQRYDEHIKEVDKNHLEHIQRITTLENKQVTEKEIRSIFKDYIDPLTDELSTVTTEVQSIKLTMSKLEKRKPDVEH